MLTHENDSSSLAEIRVEGDNSILLVDDDKPFVTRLARAFEQRGFDVRTAESVSDGTGADRKSVV